jgi:hypothetical protein
MIGGATSSSYVNSVDLLPGEPASCCGRGGEGWQWPRIGLGPARAFVGSAHEALHQLLRNRQSHRRREVARVAADGRPSSEALALGRRRRGRQPVEREHRRGARGDQLRSAVHHPREHDSPWINFEAGALAKSTKNGRVCPYLIDLPTADLAEGPLTAFQSKEASSRTSTQRLPIGAFQSCAPPALRPHLSGPRSGNRRGPNVWVRGGGRPAACTRNDRRGRRHLATAGSPCLRELDLQRGRRLGRSSPPEASERSPRSGAARTASHNGGGWRRHREEPRLVWGSG